MNNRQRLVLTVLIVFAFFGCTRATQNVTTKLEVPKPDPVIPIDWNGPIPFMSKGGETEILDGPTTYREHYEKGWCQFLMEYANQLHPDLDIPFPCQPFSFTLAEGDGYDACKSKITELENTYGRKMLLREIQRSESSDRQ